MSVASAATLQSMMRTPGSVRRRFDGLMSRWKTPLGGRRSRPVAVSSAMRPSVFDREGTPCQGFRSVLLAGSMDRWSTVVSLSIVRAQKVEQADTLESLAYSFGWVCDPQRRIHGAGGVVCTDQNANARGVDE
jgi:hypothetical protein